MVGRREIGASRGLLCDYEPSDGPFSSATCSYKIISIISPVTVQSRGGVTMVIKVSLVTFRSNKETFVYLYGIPGMMYVSTLVSRP